MLAGILPNRPAVAEVGSRVAVGPDGQVVALGATSLLSSTAKTRQHMAIVPNGQPAGLAREGPWLPLSAVPEAKEGERACLPFLAALNLVNNPIRLP
jgi:hypothetical protein